MSKWQRRVRASAAWTQVPHSASGGSQKAPSSSVISRSCCTFDPVSFLSMTLPFSQLSLYSRLKFEQWKYNSDITEGKLLSCKPKIHARSGFQTEVYPGSLAAPSESATSLGPFRLQSPETLFRVAQRPLTSSNFPDL